MNICLNFYGQPKNIKYLYNQEPTVSPKIEIYFYPISDNTKYIKYKNAATKVRKEEQVQQREAPRVFRGGYQPHRQ